MSVGLKEAGPLIGNLISRDWSGLIMGGIVGRNLTVCDCGVCV